MQWGLVRKVLARPPVVVGVRLLRVQLPQQAKLVLQGLAQELIRRREPVPRLERRSCDPELQ